MKEAVKRIIRYREIKQIYEKYERWLVPGMLLVGVATDFLTFRTIQINTAFTLLGIYFIITCCIIAFLHIYNEHWSDKKSYFIRYLRLASPLIIQFHLELY